MKKTFFLLTVLFGMSLVATAQVRVAYGLRGGGNLSSWRGETVQSLGNLLDATNGNVSTVSRFGFHAGGYAAVYLTDRFAIEPGLQYSLKGTELNGRLSGSSDFLNLLNANAVFRVQSHYIEMPILAKVYVTDGLHFFAGPQVGYLVDNQLRTRASVFGFAPVNRTFDISNGFQRWDFSGVVGAGYKFENGFNLMAAYDHGFQRIDANRRFATFNRTFKLSMGYEF